jgi:hypothetical protein
MNQSVIVFADAAARTTAIPTPIQGMLTYLVDTAAYESWNGSAYVALVEDPDLTSLIPKSTVTTAQDLIVADGASSVTRLGVGTDDQVLSVVAGEVAWADAGGGGWTLLSTTSLSTITTTITGINQSYKDLKIEGTNIQTTSSGAVYLYLRNSSSDLSNARLTSNGSSDEQGGGNFIPLDSGNDMSTTTELNFNMNVSNYSATSHQKAWTFFGGAYFGGQSRGISGFGSTRFSDDAVEGFKIEINGTPSAGEIKIYGGN